MSRFWRMRLLELGLLVVLAVLFTAAGAVIQLIAYGHVRW